MSTTDRWVKRWDAAGSNGHMWVVAVDAAGAYGCSCPRWKFHREECHHIGQVRLGSFPARSEEPRKFPKYVLVHSCNPELVGDELHVPLVAIGDTHMEATICYVMMRNGYSWRQVKEFRPGLPKQWTAKGVFAHIAAHGEAWRPCCGAYPHTDRKEQTHG